MISWCLVLKMCVFSATSGFPVGVLLAAVQVDVVGSSPGLSPRRGPLPLPPRPLFAVRKVSGVNSGRSATSERRVTQPHQRNLVRVGSSPQFRHWRR